jgi:hypothetical protein
MRDRWLTRIAMACCFGVLTVVGPLDLRANTPALAGPEEAAAVEEFERLWATLGRATDVGSIEYRELVQQTKESVQAIGNLGPVGHRVLIEHLQRPDVRLVTDLGFPQSAYTEVKIVIIDVLADHGATEATPALVAVVEPAHLLVRTPPPPRKPISPQPCEKKRSVKHRPTIAKGRRAEMPERRPQIVGRVSPQTAAGPGPRVHDFEALDRMRYRVLADPAVRALGRLGDRSAVPVLREIFPVVWENLPRGAPLFTSVPDALVALDDDAYVEELIVPFLNGDDPKKASQAAYLAQKPRDGRSLIPHLIEYLRKSDNPTACSALNRITGQPYIDVTSWDEWWELNRDWPRDEWLALEANAGRTARWEQQLIELIETRYLPRNPMGWRRPDRPGRADWKAASLQLAATVHALGLARPVTAYLETRIEDDALTSGTGPSPGVTGGLGGRSRSKCREAAPGPPQSYHSALDVPISTNVKKLLAAIACTGNAAHCAEWDELTSLEGILGVDFRSGNGE